VEPGARACAGANGAQVYESVMANARSKIVFSLEGEENLKSLAQSLFMGVMNPDEIKLQLHSRKVMDYVEETRIIHSESENWSEGVGEFNGQTGTESEGGAIQGGDEQEQRLWNKSNANSNGTSHTSMKGGGKGKSIVPHQKAVFGEELSSVQFRGLDDQLHRAMASLFDQKQRHGVTKIVGVRAPVNIVTPFVEKMPTPKKMIDSYLTSRYEKLPFALRSEDAHRQIKERDQKFISGAGRTTEPEEIAVRRKIG